MNEKTAEWFARFWLRFHTWLPKRPHKHGRPCSAHASVAAVILLLLSPLTFARIPVRSCLPGTQMGSGASEQGLRRKLDRYIESEVRGHHFQGSVLVAGRNVILLACGYGYADAEWKIPNTPDTKFRLGSITKQFTATAIMQLRERHLIALHASVCKYIQPCPDTWKAVTVRELLSHTAGIPDFTQDPSRTREEVLSRLRLKPLDFPPGTQWKYSNSGYFLLGSIIEHITGKPYAQVLAERIFNPLGMRDTGYDDSETVLAHRASGYQLANGRLLNADYIDMRLPFSAGGLYSTVLDLYRWDQALYTQSVLPRQALELMWTPVLHNYGFGWSIVKRTSADDAHYRVWHNGGINGFLTQIDRYPDDHVTVIVLANSEDADVPGLARGLAAIMFGNPPGSARVAPGS